MGDFWDLWQESEIDYQRQVSSSLEERGYALEETLTSTVTLLQATIKMLEIKACDGNNDSVLEINVRKH